MTFEGITLPVCDSEESKLSPNDIGKKITFSISSDDIYDDYESILKYGNAMQGRLLMHTEYLNYFIVRATLVRVKVRSTSKTVRGDMGVITFNCNKICILK